jgi:hypothetical protein
VGIVVLENRVGYAPIEVESAAVSAGTSIVMGNAELDKNTVGVMSPDANGAVPFARHVPAVVPGFTVLDGCILNLASHYNAVAAVIVFDGRIARVIFGQAVSDVKVSGLTPMARDPRIAIVVSIDMSDPSLFDPAESDT